MANKKWIVELTLDERKELLDMVNKGKAPAYKIKHANILLKTDQGEYGENWTDKKIAKAYNCQSNTVYNVRKRFVEEGFERALGRNKRKNYKRKLDGDQEAQLIALACSEPPEGASRWTMVLLSEKVVEKGIVDNVSPSTIQRMLKKNELKPWKVDQWCIPKASGDFVAKMENILEIYKRPYDEKIPVICFDETNIQLVEETRVSIPPKPGKNKKVDYEYRRKGVGNIFMIFEPLQGVRYVETREQRTGLDFASCMKNIADVYYPDCEKVIVVMDNLNTHKTGSLYDKFQPKEARRIAEKLEFQYTPKHGSWLNMAEIEISVLTKQCLSRHIPTLEQLDSESIAWANRRNQSCGTVNWQFTTQDARIKLKRLYPQIDEI